MKESTCSIVNSMRTLLFSSDEYSRVHTHPALEFCYVSRDISFAAFRRLSRNLPGMFVRKMETRK